MNKDMKAVARLLKHGHEFCGMCGDEFPTRQLRAVLHENVVRLACPCCVQKVPQAERSSMDVGQIIALKERIKAGADLDNPQTWLRDSKPVEIHGDNSGESAVEGKP